MRSHPLGSRIVWSHRQPAFLKERCLEELGIRILEKNKTGMIAELVPAKSVVKTEQISMPFQFWNKT